MNCLKTLYNCPGKWYPRVLFFIHHKDDEDSLQNRTIRIYRRESQQPPILLLYLQPLKICLPLTLPRHSTLTLPWPYLVLPTRSDIFFSSRLPILCVIFLFVFICCQVNIVLLNLSSFCDGWIFTPFVLSTLPTLFVTYVELFHFTNYSISFVSRFFFNLNLYILYRYRKITTVEF